MTSTPRPSATGPPAAQSPAPHRALLPGAHRIPLAAMHPAPQPATARAALPARYAPSSNGVNVPPRPKARHVAAAPRSMQAWNPSTRGPVPIVKADHKCDLARHVRPSAPTRASAQYIVREKAPVRPVDAIGRPMAPAALGLVDRLCEQVSNCTDSWARRPDDPGVIRPMMLALAAARQASAPSSTLKAEESATKWWNSYCKTFNTSTTRPDARCLSFEGLCVEQSFWGCGLVWIHERMPAKISRIVGEAQPQSALAVLSCIRRASRRMGIETVPLTAAVQAMDGLLRLYILRHGPDALIPNRKEPLTNGIIIKLFNLPNGTWLSPKGHSRLDWNRDHMRSLLAMFHTLAQTGMRKAEVSLHGSIELDKSHLLMSNVVWQIDGQIIAAPTRGDLARLQIGDYALLTPAPSKADQFCKHWGASVIYLMYDSDKVATPICAARELAKEEWRRDVAPNARDLGLGLGLGLGIKR